jgi:putative ABC transport system permease protein
MSAIVIILIVASLMLGGVVLYNLGVLSFSERTREFATLKVLGFFPKKIQELMRRQNIWTTVMGIIVGIPAGYGLVMYMTSTMSDSMDMRAYISITSYLISILGVFILSFTVNLFLSRKIKDIDMVSSLKSVE